MVNDQHKTWQAKRRDAKKWQKWVGYCLMGKTPPKPLQRVRVTFTRYSSVQPDDDNLPTGFKAIRDALVNYGVVVDDSPQHFEGKYVWAHAPNGRGKIRIEIDERTSDTAPGAVVPGVAPAAPPFGE